MLPFRIDSLVEDTYFELCHKVSIGTEIDSRVGMPYSKNQGKGLEVTDATYEYLKI